MEYNSAKLFKSYIINTPCSIVLSDGQDVSRDPEKVRYKVIGGEMKGMESSMKLVALGATQRKG